MMVFIKTLLCKVVYRKNIIAHPQFKIKGIKNIYSQGILSVGLSYNGTDYPRDKTFLNIEGEFNIKSDYSIGRGCRFHIGINASISIGNGGYLNSKCNLIIMHKLTIGDNCIIAWNCQFLDEDFHHINYEEKKEIDNAIYIGNKVWIGCGVSVFKGSYIPNGCVVAANSIIINKFKEENCLRGRNPARILKRNINWT